MEYDDRNLLKDIAVLRDGFDSVRRELAKVIVGQETVIEKVLSAMLAGGHCLLLGVPGLAKTLLVSTLGQVLDLNFKRIQFTPDLMPSDITGTEILDEAAAGVKRELRFVKGPVFTNLLLADEINRTPPKTQAAMLEAMQEKSVTSGGMRYPLPTPFFVLATQNPIEQEGTYPLPEAQLDRFMFLVKLDYPEREQEIEILSQTVRAVPVSRHVISYCADLARLSRPDNPDAPDFIRRNLSYGAGPRAGQYLMLAAKAAAALDGRVNVCCEDVRKSAHEVLRHRMACNFHAAGENLTTDALIDMLLQAVPEPRN